MPVDYAKAARWMKKELNALRQLRDDPDFLTQNRAKIEAYVAGRGTLGGATVGLMCLAGHESTEGCRRVLDGDAAGWFQVDRACLYSTWILRLLTSAYDADPRPDKQPRANLDEAANAWTHAEALGAADLRDWLEGRIRKIDAGDGSLGGKDMNSLVALVAHFATGKDPAALKRSGWADIGPYARAASRELRPGDYDELADYHTRQVAGPGFPAFDRYPYRLIPFELFAIEKRTGVTIGEPRHPLLASPLAMRREVREIPMPDELRRVIDRARTELPLQ
jgi:hypothetical protein